VSTRNGCLETPAVAKSSPSQRSLTRRMQAAWPAFTRRAPLVLFTLASAVLAAFPIIPELFGPGKGKDYPLWFDVGQWVLHGRDLYGEGEAAFRFLYPPFAALPLAGLSYFGRAPMIVLLTLVNIASWWVAIGASDRLAAENRPLPWWAPVLPSVLCIFFVYGMFLLGQPNLLLLAMMLGGLCLLQAGRSWSAGALFAAAAAVKAFPFTILPYLVWRRYWRAAASMVIFVAVFLVLAPAPFRGYQRNLDELQIWFRGMLLSHDENAFSQRSGRNWGWKNQSLYAVTHRLVRPVDAEAEASGERPLYVNIATLDYKTADWVFFSAATSIGLAFILAMPPRRRRTPQSDAAELAILLCLVVISSPVAYSYFFVWLLFPLTVLVYRAAAAQERFIRWGTWGLIAVAMALLAIGVPDIHPRYGAAVGNSLWATAVLIAGLAWHMRLAAARS
jgi:glycosyl transferase family 87